MTAIPDDDLQACLRVLAAMLDGDPEDDTFQRVAQAATRLHKHARRVERRARDQAARAHDRELIEAAGMHRLKSMPPMIDDSPAGFVPLRGPDPALQAKGPVAVLRRERSCYACRHPYRELDPWYHLLCPACAADHRQRRVASADLTGRRAIVTGGRVKIGFHVAHRLLQCGAEVHVTTRFPADAARRFAGQADFDEWRDRLTITGLDFLHVEHALAFLEGLQADTRPWDILINNAAQTVRRPAEWYAPMVEREALPLAEHERRLLTAHSQPSDPVWQLTMANASDAGAEARLTQRQLMAWFPRGLVDHEGVPLDLRDRNTWVESLDEVSPRELVETTVVNQIIPFLFCSRLRPLMTASPFADRYIVNVSAMEGKFNYNGKSTCHPHTNMAKAALNMLTRTSAADYAADSIFMTSVDTGWITQESPEPNKRRAEAMGFQPPLDVIDGAARVLDPVLQGVNAKSDDDRLSGVFLKDYRVVDW